MCFLRGPLRWLTEQKNPKFLRSLQNAQRHKTNLAVTLKIFRKSCFSCAFSANNIWLLLKHRESVSKIIFFNKPYSRYPPSLHALRDWWDKSWMSRGFSGWKQVKKTGDSRNRGGVSLSSTKGKLLVKVFILTLFGSNTDRRCPFSM